MHKIVNKSFGTANKNKRYIIMPIYAKIFVKNVFTYTFRSVRCIIKEENLTAQNCTMFSNIRKFIVIL